jgi:transcriptional regulator with XRE-family HTH domain
MRSGVTLIDMRDILDTTGKRIRLLRQDRYLKQASVVRDLSKMGVEVSQTYISKLENNDVTPNGRIIAGLAKILGTTADYLLLLTDDPDPHGAEENTVDEEEEEELGQPARKLDPKLEGFVDRYERLDSIDQQRILRIMDELIDYVVERQGGVRPAPEESPPAADSQQTGSTKRR